MNLRYLIPLLATPLTAGEITIEKKPFRIEQSFTASALPESPAVLTLNPESWESFSIERIAEHGSTVEAGELVIAFDDEGYQRKRADLKRGVEQKTVALASQQLEFDKLKEEVELQLSAARRKKEIADEDLAYFRKTGRPAQEAATEERLKQFRFQLDGEKEELKQLTQMYEEDDLTEQTEEIILERQKFSVASAEFSLEQAERQAELTLKTTLPRQAEELERAAAEAAIALDKAEQNLPRSVKAAELELEGARTALEREQADLARLEQDGALFKWEAPTAGVVFYGGIEEGKWSLGDLAKALVAGGTVPVRRGLVSIVPADRALPLQARLDGAVARTLAAGMAMSVTLPGREDLGLSGKITALDEFCGTDGKYCVRIEVAWPEDLPPSPTADVECVAVVHANPEAVVVPVKALCTDETGAWSVAVKLADGATERRTVERGRGTKDEVEILSGLEPGQVVMFAD